MMKKKYRGKSRARELPPPPPPTQPSSSSTIRRVVSDNEEEDDDANDANADENDSDEQFYTVERIVGHERSDKSNRCKYLIKWAGYASHENTWETEENIIDKLPILGLYIFLTLVFAAVDRLIFLFDLRAEYWDKYAKNAEAAARAMAAKIVQDAEAHAAKTIAAARASARAPASATPPPKPKAIRSGDRLPKLRAANGKLARKRPEVVATRSPSPLPGPPSKRRKFDMVGSSDDDDSDGDEGDHDLTNGNGAVADSPMKVVRSSVGSASETEGPSPPPPAVPPPQLSSAESSAILQAARPLPVEDAIKVLQDRHYERQISRVLGVKSHDGHRVKEYDVELSDKSQADVPSKTLASRAPRILCDFLLASLQVQPGPGDG
ncbi:hypothetical protein BC828DRAFT_387922 [Blastocladiella britannica]|nr:hypothetical protein BC828DRAFT_387922 [Blastocladiella britannica]